VPAGQIGSLILFVSSLKHFPDPALNVASGSSQKGRLSNFSNKLTRDDLSTTYRRAPKRRPCIIVMLSGVVFIGIVKRMPGVNTTKSNTAKAIINNFISKFYDYII